MPDLSHAAVADHAAFEERLRTLPQSPGVYLWKDRQGTLLYIGKSKNLHDRMRAYFGSPRGLSEKTRRMVGQIADFEIIVTQNELEALLLEMNLIKQHRPRYNILLKDDKSYPYIKVTLQEEWPRIFPTRKVADDGARYFGPYASAASMRTTLELLNRLFAFRPSYECSNSKFAYHKRKGKPCLYYDMKRCLGPCVPDLIGQDDYRAAIESVCRFLEGKSEQVVRDVRHQMEEAADALNFERAAYLRDQVRAIERVLEKQQVLRTVSTDQDVIAFAREDGSAVVQVLFIRGGKLIGTEPFALQGTDDESDTHLLSSFLTQFYNQAPDVPPSLLLAEHIEEPMIIEQWLSQKRGHRVEIQVPRRGEKRRLIELAARNASQKLEELRSQWLNSEQRIVAALSDLRDLLDLSGLPQRIECYDVSNTQGQQSVASMVVFEQGKPRVSAYRRFKIKSVEGANDVASIGEVIRRRFKRAAANPPPSEEEGHPSPWAELPDLILIDGGEGQLHATLDALRETGFATIPAAGIAKGPDRNRFDLVRPGAEEVIALPRDSKALHLIQQIDEEAHRFAITYHRSLRNKAGLRSTLDDIPGIGPQRKRALLKAFGSLDGIRKASLEELAALPGMTRKAAESLKELL
jgi:excinuclease ABC subunit C